MIDVSERNTYALTANACHGSCIPHSGSNHWSLPVAHVVQDRIQFIGKPYVLQHLLSEVKTPLAQEGLRLP
jgi:hypothetical protein